MAIQYVKKLSERQQLNLVALYAQGGVSMASLAKKYNVSESTVCNIIHAHTDYLQKKQGKIKEQAKKDAEIYVKEFIEQQTGMVTEVAAKALGLMFSGIDEASVRDVAGVFKICLDAMQTMTEQQKKNDTAIDDKKALETYVAELKRYSEHE